MHAPLWKKLLMGCFWAAMATVMQWGVQFPACPPFLELAWGEEMAREHRGLPSTIDADRRIIGKWSPGLELRPVEQAIWISPRLAARWLGHLNATEHWSFATLKSRWCALAHNLDGQMLFVVQISAFPKADLLEDGSGLESPLGSLDLDSAVVTYDKSACPGTPDDHFSTRKSFEGRAEGQITSLVRLSSDHWRKLFDPYWVTEIPALDPLRPSYAQSPSPYDFCLGDYHTGFYAVSVRITPALLSARTLTLHLMNGEKDRTAVFQIR